ncbi:MAG TPA: hypothetical protein VE379_03025, partial [Vicinamibacterales bacterium]|nr:hypothetical protein [Vicinamibacterales bacterium]
VLPWCVPYLAVLAFASSAFLTAEHPAWAIVFAVQASFYAAGLWGVLRPAQLRGLSIKPAAAYFLLCQGALVVAWYRVLKGERIYVWRPTNQ